LWERCGSGKRLRENATPCIVDRYEPGWQRGEAAVDDGADSIEVDCGRSRVLRSRSQPRPPEILDGIAVADAVDPDFTVIGGDQHPQGGVVDGIESSDGLDKGSALPRAEQILCPAGLVDDERGGLLCCGTYKLCNSGGPDEGDIGSEHENDVPDVRTESSQTGGYGSDRTSARWGLAHLFHVRLEIAPVRPDHHDASTARRGIDRALNQAHSTDREAGLVHSAHSARGSSSKDHSVDGYSVVGHHRGGSGTFCNRT
jgi:hypothetical protein